MKDLALARFLVAYLTTWLPPRSKSKGPPTALLWSFGKLSSLNLSSSHSRHRAEVMLAGGMPKTSHFTFSLQDRGN